MSEFVMSLFQISLSTGLVIGLVLLLTPLLKKRYAAKWRYLLWILIAVRLCVLVNFTLPNAPVNVSVSDREVLSIPAISSGQADNMTANEDDNTPSAPTADHVDSLSKDSGIKLNLSTLLFAVWILGVAGFVAVQGIGYLRFLRRLRYSFRAETPKSFQSIWEEAGEALGVRSSLPRIEICSGVSSPVLVGLLHPKLYLPRGNYSERELEYIFRHEMVHFKRRDLWWKFLLTGALALHWFNPLVHLMVAQGGRDIELSCDDRVVRELSEGERAFYGETILRALPLRGKSRSEPVFTTSFGSTKRDLKRRIKNLFDHRVKKRGIAAAAIAAVTLLTIGGMVGCSEKEKDGGIETHPLPHIVSFGTVEEKATFGPYDLLPEESYLISLSFKGADKVTLSAIPIVDGQNGEPVAKYEFTDGQVQTVEVSAGGDYFMEMKTDTPVTSAYYEIKKTGDADVNIASNTVFYKEVEVRQYSGGGLYIHDVIFNGTDKMIVSYKRGMLAFDENGQPLELPWNPFSDAPARYLYEYDADSENIGPGATRDSDGGWSISGSLSLGDISTPTGVALRVKYVLYAFAEITFSDGTLWKNQDYTRWKDTFEGKKADVSLLESYYPHGVQIN